MDEIELSNYFMRQFLSHVKVTNKSNIISHVKATNGSNIHVHVSFPFMYYLTSIDTLHDIKFQGRDNAEENQNMLTMEHSRDEQPSAITVGLILRGFVEKTTSHGITHVYIAPGVVYLSNKKFMKTLGSRIKYLSYDNVFYLLIL